MNPLQRALIEKAGNDHGFEYILTGEHHAVNLASARHRAQVRVALDDGQFVLDFSSPAVGLLSAELARSFPNLSRIGASFVATDQDALARLLRRAAALAHSLPNQAMLDFEAKLKGAMAPFSNELIKGTEVERLVRQRVGQQAFRSAMLAYWSGACAVTGLAIPDVLRASHAKPWAECASDAERLDVFNGFLLSANLDALFDRLLISFSAAGELLVAPSIAASDATRLGLDKPLRLRWLATGHLRYLQFHQARFWENR